MTTLISNATLPGSLATADVPAGPIDLLVDSGAIADVAPHHLDRRADEVVDASGLVITPGLIDTHIHLEERAHLDALAAAGVTTAVDLGTWPDTLIQELHAATDTADFISAGCTACAPGGSQVAHMGFPPEAAVAGPEDAERFVAWRVANGSQVIKIIIEDPHGPVPALAPETIKALVDAARARGLITFAHVVTPYAYTLGLDAGVDILTHTPMTAPVAPEQVERMLDQGTICSPTLIMMKGVAQARAGLPGPVMDVENALESVRRMVAAGVPVVAGTDANATPNSPSPVAHGEGLHQELELLVEAGMTPAQAIDAATSVAAAAVGLDDRGVLTTGLRADFVLYSADPTLDVANSRAIQQVWIAGRRVR